MLEGRSRPVLALPSFEEIRGDKKTFALFSGLYHKEHNYENDQHYNHGHAVEYDSPSGAHYAEQDYTNYDSHVAESDAAYGEHYAATEHDASFGELDYLREHFDADFAHADYGNEGGQQELSAVSK